MFGVAKLYFMSYYKGGLGEAPPCLLLETEMSLVLLHLLSLHTNRSVVLGQVVGELLVWRLLEHGLLPQVWCQVGVGGGHSSVGSLGEVTQSSSGSTSRGVAVINTSHLQQLLGDRSGDNTSSTRSGDQSHPDGATLASHLAGDSVRTTNLVAPETSSDRNNGELGQDDGASDGSGDLLGALDTKTNVSIIVSNS